MKGKWYFFVDKQQYIKWIFCYSQSGKPRSQSHISLSHPFIVFARFIWLRVQWLLTCASYLFVYHCRDIWTVCFGSWYVYLVVKYFVSCPAYYVHNRGVAFVFDWSHAKIPLCLFQGVQERANLTSPLLSKEDPIFSSLSHKLGRSVDEVGHRIHQGLLRVRSACTTLPH